ncbi:LuxR C-terminal-related transcriptional regulator [Streptomyces sp. MP131-18]|uniref:helix-turn-helix transcriptional regulator n=1 Tax=Streptomyces sp. MP131-18 TaxID=1857892 RepID=UPI00097C2F3C|nr:LuxR C-terminal-related transcriptional regulator [Streptomyces sp. MP131-18]ONK10457.1 Bacterial regulatory protein, luxR family [Streptomyces sp. MP131-18]
MLLPPRLEEHAYQVYDWVLENREVDYPAMAADLGLHPSELRDAVDTLVAWRLLRELPDRSAIVAARPDAALAEAMLPLENAITRHRLEVSRTRDEFDRLMSVYLVAGEQSVTEPLSCADDVDHALSDLAGSCTREVLVANPGKDPAPRALRQTLWGETGLREGVRVRVLYQHPSRLDATTREHTSAARRAAAEVRTVGELHDRIVVFDRQVAVLIGEGAQAGMVVRETSVVDFLARVFDRSWEQGLDFAGEAGRQHEVRELADSVQQSIVRLLVQGIRDEEIARRLDISVRTCRRHIAKVMDRLGSESRFQAGYLLRKRGWEFLINSSDHRERDVR